MVLQIAILGSLEPRINGNVLVVPAGKQRALLTLLAIRAPDPVPAESAAEALWPGAAPAEALRSLQVTVSRLRRSLLDGGAALETVASAYRLALEPDAIDARRFEALIGEARAARVQGDAAAARRLLDDGLGLWRGPALADAAYESFAQTEIARLEELRVAALEERIDARLEQGEHPLVVAELEQLSAEHPSRERLVGLLMLALYRCGRQADALEIYTQYRRRLDAELGLEPSSQLRRLQEAILRQDLSLDARVGEPVAQGQPGAVAPSLPAQLRPRPAMPFVGRAAELGQLAALPDRARTDGRQIALVGGEPGSGKTRLARELAEHVTSGGMRVLYGACDPAVRTPYQPFVEALEPAVAVLEADESEPSAGRYPETLTRLLPGLRARAGEVTTAIADAELKDPEAERHELHSALTALLARFADHSPAVLVLDDVQWADTSSLILLRHVARTLGATPIVVLALFRDGDGELPEALASTLAELHRLEGVLRVRLGGLAVADVQELVDRSDESVRGADAELAEQLVGLTDGNAFLVGEVWRHMLDRDAVASPADAIPESVREVMADRVAGLTPALRELLQLIAVSPRGIALPVLRAAAGIDDEALLGVLDEGLHTGMLDEFRDASLVYRVHHELLRRTVYERLSSFRAATLHLRVGEALEAMPEGRRDRIVNELAFHFRAAAPVAGNGRAVEYALDAAAQAERSLAFAEAATRFEEALTLGVSGLAAEAEVRCRQGRAWHLAGRPRDALESFAAAAAAAREGGEEALQARAAIGFETACWRPGIEDPRAVALLREAALGITAESSAQRVRVLAHLSRALAYRGDHAEAGECWSQAVAMARLVDDPGALRVALSHAAWMRGWHSATGGHRTQSRHSSECPRRWTRHKGSGCTGSSRASNG